MGSLAMAHAQTILPRRLIFWGASLLPAGIAIAAVFSPPVGSILTLTALAALIAGAHLFGRAGPDLGA
jgi:hypothetical protein